MDTDQTYSGTARNSDANGAIENSKAIRNREALLTAGMGYGGKKRRSLAAFWSIVWPGLEKIGWKRIVSEGNDEGSMLFLPPGIANMILGKRNIDYYDKIKLVINRLEERQNIEEGKIFDLFRNEVRIDDDDMLASRPKRGTGRPRLGVSRPSREVEEIDTSWKDGRCLYPKRSSQVGAGYQVAIIPRAGTIVTERQLDEPKYDLIWNWKKAKKRGMLNFIEDNVPQNKREKAMQLVHDNNYSIVNTNDLINQIDQTNVSNWTTKDREKFRIEIFRCRKNFKALCQSMGNKEMGDIIAYYLGHYKKSDDYRLLKTVRLEERIEKAEQSNHDVDHCAICGEGGNLLICDGCESEWHMECTKPSLKNVPEGRWECDVCIDRNFLEGRKRILKDVKSNISVRKLTKRTKMEHVDIGSEGSQDTDTALADVHMTAMEALKVFSRNIDSILTKTSMDSKSQEEVQENK